jgi:uncharacterized membrane protein YheB (UPF0754 family)
MGLLDFASGETNKAVIEAAQYAHQRRFAARDQASEGRKMFHELAKEEKFRKDFVQAVKEKLSKEVVKDEEAALHHIGALTGDLRKSLKDDVMIAHLVIQALTEFIHADEKIQREGFPHNQAVKLIDECQKEMEGIKRLLYDYSTILRQESGEGGN